MKKLINLANFISVFRAFLAIISVFIYLKSPNQIFFFNLTILIILLDGLDGIIARYLKECSEFGAKLDIYSDRLIELLYWWLFSFLNLIPFWIFWFFLSRGLLVDIISAKASKPLGESFLRSSRFMRGSYGFLKLLSFSLLILIPDYKFLEFNLALLSSYLAVLVCALRALPVIFKPLQAD